MYDSHVHSFITKIWLEESAVEAGQAVWRGTITHVPSGTRRHLQSLEDILAFIVPYLRDMGIQFDLRCRVSRWVERMTRRPYKER
jgi:hypothetical protein